MIVLEQITPANVLAFKTTRLQALQDSPNAFGSTYACESQMSNADWLKRAADRSKDGSVGYLAMDQGGVCGIVAAFLDEQNTLTAHLVSMWVAPLQRRTGVGRALISAVQTWAKNRGVHTLKLTVTSNNHSAIGFYERSGFSMTGNTEPYPNDATLVEHEMSKPIEG